MKRLEARLWRLFWRKDLPSTAESCTGGWVGKRLTDISGSSAAFQGGVISYTNAVKHQVLQVPEQMLKQCGAVSEEVARAMAEGVRALLKTDLGISTTGVAGPSSDEMGNPIGLVYIALATPKETCCRETASDRRPGTDTASGCDKCTAICTLLSGRRGIKKATPFMGWPFYAIKGINLYRSGRNLRSPGRPVRAETSVMGFANALTFTRFSQEAREFRDEIWL